MAGTNINSAMTATSPILWIRELEPTPTGPNGYAYAISACCLGTPPVTAGLFRNGCNIIQLDSSGNVNYQNTGTVASPVWSAYDSSAGGPIPLPTGEIFVGVSNIATAKTLGATFAGNSDTTSSVSGGTPAGTNSAPALTIGGAALVATLNGFTGTTSGKVTTISAGGATVAAHALAGAVVSDGTVETTILDNTALTATSGTITTVTALSATITATGVAYQRTGTVAAPVFTGAALAGHTHTVTSTGTITPTYT